MKILGMMHQHSGCGYHRVLLPLGFMPGITGYVTNVLTEDKQEGWDIFLFNRLSCFDHNWTEAKKLIKAKVVMDIDDYWVLPHNHINHIDYEHHKETIENNLINADMVTVTNQNLYDKVKPFNSNVHIFPNALPFGKNQFTEERRESDRVRIFWAGGVTHEHDLKLLQNPFKRLSIFKDKIQMVIGGYNDDNEQSKAIWDRMLSYFTQGLPYMKLHGTSPTSYMQMYENADIVVIPLEDTDWHRSKSNLKILEAAAKRLPVIVSNVEPYSLDKDAPVLWVNSQKDWFEHLKYLILNPDARVELGNKLYEWAKEKYSLETVNERRFAAFSDLCKA